MIGCLFAVVVTAALWQWIVKPPRSGTIIEVEDRFGPLAERSLQRWDGAKWVEVSPSPGAASVDPETGPCVFWRSFTGAVSSYDPHNPSAANTVDALRHPKKLSACTSQDASP